MNRIEKRLKIQNDSCEFAIFSKSLCGYKQSEVFQSLSEYSNKENPFIKEGILFYISQVQDDSARFNIVLGELKDYEKANWWVKTEYNLKIPCGQLGISGGWDHMEDEKPIQGFVDYAEVPNGNYHLTLYCYDKNRLYIFDDDYDEDEEEDYEDEDETDRLNRNIEEMKKYYEEDDEISRQMFYSFLIHLEPIEVFSENTENPKWIINDLR